MYIELVKWCWSLKCLQISLLMKEKRILLKRLQKSGDISVNTKSNIKESKKDVTYVEEIKEETSELSAISHEVGDLTLKCVYFAFYYSILVCGFHTSC